MGNLRVIYDCSSFWKSLVRLFLKKYILKSKFSCFVWDMVFDLIKKKMVQDFFLVIKVIDKML